MIQVVTVTRFLATGIAYLALSSCGLIYTNVEVARVTSPGGDVDAVVHESNGGATTSFGYDVSVVEAGKRMGVQSVAGFYGAVRSEKAYGVNLLWISEDELQIQYYEARDSVLSRPTVKVAGRNIRVSVKAGVYDPEAPAGGMEYSLRRNRDP